LSSIEQLNVTFSSFEHDETNKVITNKNVNGFMIIFSKIKFIL